ncbi:MAG: hypothetical protein J5968_05940 [Oscillospiraceae bacterium]|nr:hypothetical protein [Oscillospiraceae bacterium]
MKKNTLMIAVLVIALACGLFAYMNKPVVENVEAVKPTEDQNITETSTASSIEPHWSECITPAEAAEEELAAEKAAAEERAALDEKLKNSEPPVFNIDENSPEYERIFAKRWSEYNNFGGAPTEANPQYEEWKELIMSLSDEEFADVLKTMEEHEREQQDLRETNPIINSQSAAEYIAEAQGVWISPEAQEAERKLAEERIKDDELARSLGFENYAALKKSADTDGDGGVSVPEGYAVGLYTKEEYDSWVAAGEFADSIVWGEVGEGMRAAQQSDYKLK